MKKVLRDPFQNKNGGSCPLDFVKTISEPQKTKFIKIQLEGMKEDALVEISNATTEEDLLRIKSKYVGKKGFINSFFKKL